MIPLTPSTRAPIASSQHSSPLPVSSALTNPGSQRLSSRKSSPSQHNLLSSPPSLSARHFDVVLPGHNLENFPRHLNKASAHDYIPLRLNSTELPSLLPSSVKLLPCPTKLMIAQFRPLNIVSPFVPFLLRIRPKSYNQPLQ